MPVQCLVCQIGHYVLRHRHADQVAFWGCWRFPECRSSLDFLQIVDGRLVKTHPTALLNLAAFEQRKRAAVRMVTGFASPLRSDEVSTVRRIARVVRVARPVFREAAPVITPRGLPPAPYVSLEQLADLDLRRAGLGLLVDRARDFPYQGRRHGYGSGWSDLD